LDLGSTRGVTGDVWEINKNDFQMLGDGSLPTDVVGVGGKDYDIQCISTLLML